MVCRDELARHEGPVVILTGDSPLTQAGSLRKLLDLYRNERPACIIGTTHKENPTGLGRIVRDEQGGFVAIVEQKDTTEQQAAIREVNMSTYVFHGPELLHALGKLTTDNAQGEYYVTDCPGILKREGKDVRALAALAPCESLSINTFDDLAAVEAEMRRQASSA
jgi:bifunctional UDP-N-acetylglucosamine pyrophosphorylase/glucosamine-1-phosphate N-acetyltransferase/UDP-N-acetylglucosamine pyrophosphorylase